MRPIKVILLSFFILGMLLFAFSLLIPSTTKVSRAITIVKPLNIVKQNILQLQNWQYWHTGLNKGLPMQVDSVANVIKNKDVIMQLQTQSDSSVQFLVKFIKGQSIVTDINFLNHKDSCTLQWLYTFKSKIYPWEKFASLLHENIYGAALDSNLTALKVYIEKQH